MNKETLRMQMLSGLITEGEYKAKLEESKESLNENFVGMGMVGNIFDREKTDFELAFEHFTAGTQLNVNEQEWPVEREIHYALSGFKGRDEGSTKEYLSTRTLEKWDDMWEKVRNLLTKYYEQGPTPSPKPQRSYKSYYSKEEDPTSGGPDKLLPGQR